MNIDEKLKIRKNDYGDYGDGRKLNVTIMELIDGYHHNQRGVYLTPLEKIMINDIITKLCRIAATPDHLDSWEDIEGYGRRISEFYGGLQNAKESESTGQEVPCEDVPGDSSFNCVHRTVECDPRNSKKCALPGRIASLCPKLRSGDMGTSPEKRLHTGTTRRVFNQDVQRANLTDGPRIYWIDLPGGESGPCRRYTFTKAQIDEFFGSLHRRQGFTNGCRSSKTFNSE